MNKQIITSGKRKTAIARAVVMKGKGIVKINGIALENFSSELKRLRVQEPLILAKDLANKVDIKVSVNGGGVTSQADAIRLAIAKGLVEFTGDEALEELFSNYDRQLLVADVRRREPSKPNRHGKARAKRQKSYR